MDNTFSTAKFIEFELTMYPVSPGTKPTPRPPESPREVNLDDTTPPAPPLDLPPETTGGDDD